MEAQEHGEKNSVSLCFRVLFLGNTKTRWDENQNFSHGLREFRETLKKFV